MPPLPDSGTILDLAASALRAEQQRLEAEQAVSNIDALSELCYHPILESGFFEAGYGVLRERPYPGLWMGRPGKRSIVPTLTERERCDLVITELPNQILSDDPTQRREGLQDDLLAAGTLFSDPAHRIAPVVRKKRTKQAASPPSSHPSSHQPAAPPSLPTLPLDLPISPDDAFWLEVKVIGQFTISRGITCPNRSYSTELVTAIYSDCFKLASDRIILRGGLLLILHAQDQRTARHDLDIAVQQAWSRGSSCRTPLVDGFPLNDRIGNTWATVALIERPAT